MSVGINSNLGLPTQYPKLSADPAKKAQKKADTGSEVREKDTEALSLTDGVDYKKGSENTVDKLVSDKNTTVEDDRSLIIAQLQADADARTATLKGIVEKLMLGQGKSSAIAGAETGENTLGGVSDEDMWHFLASGDFTVDAVTKAKAQEDISEDGYWGVNKTSDRILDFAKTLSGNDVSKAQELLDAFKKGYDEATAAWGKELPSISSQTYDAVMQKFENWMNEEESLENQAETAAATV